MFDVKKLAVFSSLGLLLWMPSSLLAQSNYQQTGQNFSNGFNSFSNGQNTNQNSYSPQGSSFSSQGSFGSVGNFGNSSGSNTLSGRSRRGSSRRGQDQSMNSNGVNPSTAQPSSNSRRGLQTQTSKPPAQASASPSAGAGGISVYGQSATDQTQGKIRKSTSDTPLVRKSATFFMDSNSSIAYRDEPFTVHVKLSNPMALEYDSLGVKLQYNSEELQLIQYITEENWVPVASGLFYPSLDEAEKKEDISAKNASSNLPAGPIVSTMLVDADMGTVQFAMLESKMNRSGIQSLTRLTFIPLRAAKRSSIQFLFSNTESSNPTFFTHLSMDGKDILGKSDNPADGVIQMDFPIRDRSHEPDSPLESMQRPNQTDGAFYNTYLQLIPDQTSVEVGDTFYVDVNFSNPARVSIDEINILMLYNPRVLQAVDADPNKPGVNIESESFQDDFSFDFPLVNDINLNKGVIDFRVKSARAKVEGHGTFARIYFKAIAPSKQTTFRILVSENGVGPTTSVAFHSIDRLGDAVNPYDGIQTASISIRPTLAYIRQVQRNG